MIVQNLKYLRNHLHSLTQAQFSDKIAVSRSRYASYETGRIEVPIDVLIRISKFYNITIDVLLKVDVSKVALDKLLKLDNNRILLPLLVNQNGDDNYIELVPEKASAGYLSGYSDAEYIENLDRFSLPFLQGGKFRAFQIQGDSMLPLKCGSYVVGRYIENSKDIISGKTYILLTKNEGCTYKRIFHQADKNSIKLFSDNKYYSPFEVAYEDIFEIWEFACCIDLQEHNPGEKGLEAIMNGIREIKADIQSIKRAH